MDDFNKTIDEIIQEAYPWIDSNTTPNTGPGGTGVDLPDPLELEVYSGGSTAGPVDTNRGIGKGGIIVPSPPIPYPADSQNVPGQEIPGSPGNPQTTFPANKTSPYSTLPFSGSIRTTSGQMKAQRPRNTNKTKKHRCHSYQE